MIDKPALRSPLTDTVQHQFFSWAECAIYVCSDGSSYMEKFCNYVTEQNLNANIIETQAIPALKSTAPKIITKIKVIAIDQFLLVYLDAIN